MLTFLLLFFFLLLSEVELGLIDRLRRCGETDLDSIR